MTIDELMEDSPFTFRQRDAKEALANQPKQPQPTDAELKQAEMERDKKIAKMHLIGIAKRR